MFRNVSLSRRKSTTRFGRSPFSEEKWRFSLDVKQKHTFITDENQRKQFANVSPSNNSYSFRITNHSTPQQQQSTTAGRFDASEGAGYLVEVAVGQYSSRLVAEWSPSDGFHDTQAVSSLPDHPTVWTDGSLVLDRVTGVSSSGAGFFAHQSEDCWRGRR